MSSLLETIKNLSSKEIFIAVASIIVVICVIVIASKSEEETFGYNCYECDDYGCDDYGCEENFGQGGWTGQENFSVGCPTCGDEEFRFTGVCPTCH